MKRIRYQLDNLDGPGQPPSGPATKEVIQENRKAGNLRQDDNGNLITSRNKAGDHLPIIDLDCDHLYVPSRTKGHAHLYINVDVSEAKYARLIDALVECGIIGEGNRNQFTVDGHTSARLPRDWETKATIYGAVL